MGGKSKSSYNKLVDSWSLALVLYEIVVGDLMVAVRSMPRCDTTKNVKDLHLKSKKQRAKLGRLLVIVVNRFAKSSEHPNVTPAFADLFGNLLQEDPKKRWR